MTIDEAIKALQADLLKPGSVDKLDFQDAEQLGIEALQRIRYQRRKPTVPHKTPLPSETTE